MTGSVPYCDVWLRLLRSKCRSACFAEDIPQSNAFQYRLYSSSASGNIPADVVGLDLNAEEPNPPPEAGRSSRNQAHSQWKMKTKQALKPHRLETRHRELMHPKILTIRLSRKRSGSLRCGKDGNSGCGRAWQKQEAEKKAPENLHLRKPQLGRRRSSIRV